MLRENEKLRMDNRATRKSKLPSPTYIHPDQ